jgi:hypothetical protein
VSGPHKDKFWRLELETHLKPLVRNGSISTWSDRQILPGSKWHSEINAALTDTAIAILLVSADFFSSDFIHENELGPLLKRADEGGVKIFWIPIRHSLYKQTPLTNYQALCDTDRPLAAIPKAKRDKVWVEISEKIHKEVSTTSAAADPAGQSNKVASQPEREQESGTTPASHPPEAEATLTGRTLSSTMVPLTSGQQLIANAAAKVAAEKQLLKKTRRDYPTGNGFRAKPFWCQ